MKKVKKFLLFSHPNISAAENAAQETDNWLAQLGMDVVLNGTMPDADAAVCFGGDGYVLDTANKLPKGRIVPLARVNFGRSGFLTNIEPREIKEKLALMMVGEYIVTARKRLEVNYTNARFLPKKGITANGLNDICVERTGNKTIRLLAEFGNMSIPVRGDGVLAATRTGSTGYNRVLGGPIITKESQIVLKLMGVPLENRSAYILPFEGECAIRVAVSDAARLVVDGCDLANIASNSIIKIREASNRTYFVEFGDVLL